MGLNRLKNTACWLMVCFLVGCQSQTDLSIQKIDKRYMLENVIGNDVQLIDVRTAAEYSADHIKGAQNFDVLQGDVFLKQIETLSKGEPVYLYCKMGGRSNRAAELMKEKGFTQIFDYSGGYNDWVQE